MSAFREHFLDKYFAYRTKYVAHIERTAPHRVRWAIASEAARLSFVFFGSGVCALLFGLLAAGAFGRHSAWALVFAVCAAVGGVFAAAALWNALRAARLLTRAYAERGGLRKEKSVKPEPSNLIPPCVQPKIGM